MERKMISILRKLNEIVEKDQYIIFYLIIS